MSDYLDTLSHFVAETSYEDLSKEALAAVKDVTLDTVGAIVAGSQLPENRALAEVAAQRSGPATATILGQGLKAEPMMATLVNSTTGVALEMDEGNRFGGGHPAIHSIPGALAVAEEMGADGRKLIESIVVGYEVESRVGGATTPRDNVHSHGHWGTIGTAAAVSKLRGYGPDQVRSVMNLAASMSPANTWTTAFRGATIRNLYPGRSGFQGILAAHLYECGFTGLGDALSDVFGTILGESFSPEAAVEGLGAKLRIQQNYFKLHACCRINHASLEAVLDARKKSDFSLDAIERIDFKVQRMLDGMLGEYPDNMLAAKFNVPYAVAVALIKNNTDITVFRPEVIADPRIRALASKVYVEVDPVLVAAGDDGPLARASIQLEDGRVVHGTTGILRGDYGNQVPRSELMAKFHFLCDDLLGEDRASTVVATIERLDGLSDVRELTSLL
jgi:2-methylcitrate dehydratase PrpD